MDKNRILSIVAGMLVILGFVMIYLGGFYAPKVMWPPILSGFAFFLIAWALNALRDKT